MGHLLDPVYQLEMRLEFIHGVLEVGFLCNFNKKRLEEIQEILLEELSFVDNHMYEVFEQTGDREIAVDVWEEGMEGIRRWLSLITGIKIKYA